MDNIIASLSDFLSQAVPSELTNDPPKSENNIISMNAFKLGLKKCISTAETDAYIRNHIKYLNWQMSSTSVSEAHMNLLIQQCLVCKAFGHDVGFADIHAIQLAQSAQKWKYKFAAYNACNILLSGSNDMTILMVSTIQRDIKSPNPVIIQVALSSASHLISSELIPALENGVAERVQHPSSVVRRKALACLGTFIHKQNDLLESRIEIILGALCDKDPMVMWTALQILCDHSLNQNSKEKESLLNILLHILNQIVNEKLPTSLKKSSISGPMIVKKLVKLITQLVPSTEQNQKALLSILAVMDYYDKAKGYTAIAAVVECCIALPQLTSNKVHLERASKYSAHLVNSNLIDLKVVGLKIMRILTECNSELVKPYQNLILNGLKSSDAEVVNGSMKVIMMLTNPSNITKVFELFKKCTDGSQLKPTHQDQGLDIITCCDLKDLNDEQWFVSTLVELVSLSPLQTVSLEKLLVYIIQSLPSQRIYEYMKCEIAKPTPLQCCDLVVILLHIVNYVDQPLSDNVTPIILSACERIKTDHNILYLLLSLQQSVIHSRLVLTPVQLSQLKTVTKRLNSDVLCHQYLKELEAVQIAPPLSSKSLSVWQAMDVYTNNQVKKGACIKVSTTSAPKEESLKFQKQMDVMDTQADASEVILKSVRKVWTAQGRGQAGHVGKAQVDDNNTDESLSPTVNEINQLTECIFSPK